MCPGVSLAHSAGRGRRTPHERISARRSRRLVASCCGRRAPSPVLRYCRIVCAAVTARIGLRTLAVASSVAVTLIPSGLAAQQPPTAGRASLVVLGTGTPNADPDRSGPAL